MKKVDFVDFDLSGTPSQEESLLDLALRLKIPLSHSCGGNGTCGTCLVHIQKGLENCGERNEIEVEMAQDRLFSSEERLACQTVITGPIEVKIKSM